jgi:hypothetical protein
MSPDGRPSPHVRPGGGFGVDFLERIDNGGASIGVPPCIKGRSGAALVPVLLG